MGTEKLDRLAAGRTYAEWFGLLDEWGAPGQEFQEISAWLRQEHQLSAWWAQKLIVEYEQARGIRPAGARKDGTLTVGASKTVNVGVEQLYRAVTEDRESWLPDLELRERTSRTNKSTRFDNADGTRVSFTFEAKDTGKSAIAVEHELIPDPEQAQQLKQFWQQRLAALKTTLEN
ncbi:DUF4287 domain-containing protein [Tenggerimyces flavus]|uniref:DUF4287 domain-containing protein n=1 Tax=Tenggerimyces flavus TaxID=1708749 RepID=A0ABV7YIG8_9ACTN|nr:DUF4287 domain-containing protein [Tenggerimyces flavus]MBM7787606.1 hypothetical protein [Tenggerimyces flavus]